MQRNQTKILFFKPLQVNSHRQIYENASATFHLLAINWNKNEILIKVWIKSRYIDINSTVAFFSIELRDSLIHGEIRKFDYVLVDFFFEIEAYPLLSSNSLVEPLADYICFAFYNTRTMYDLTPLE